MLKEREPDTAGRRASLFLQILSCASTDDTRDSLDTLDLLVQKYEPSTRTPLAEPLKVALVQRGVKERDVLNHLVMHATRLNTHASVCEEVRNIMNTRATLVNMAQPTDIGALDKVKRKRQRQKARRVTGAKRKGVGKQGAGSPRGKANENPDKDLQSFYHPAENDYRCKSLINSKTISVSKKKTEIFFNSIKQ